MARLPTVPVRIPADAVELDGDLAVPAGALGVVVFAHGSGSSRRSPRNRHVAQALGAAGIGTLLFDLLTLDEAEVRANVFDIPLLARRLVAARDAVAGQASARGLGIGYFGASTGAAAALVAAADDSTIRAIVSRGGRPDLAREALPRVTAPTLLVVGGDDASVIRLNEAAYGELRCEKRLVVVPGAGHLFEEPGTLDEVVRLATEWLLGHLGGAS